MTGHGRQYICQVVNGQRSRNCLQSIVNTIATAWHRYLFLCHAAGHHLLAHFLPGGVLVFLVKLFANLPEPLCVEAGKVQQVIEL